MDLKALFKKDDVEVKPVVESTENKPEDLDVSRDVLKDVHPHGATEAQVKESIERLTEEAKSTIEEREARLTTLHAELAEAADGRTEDQIGLSDNYWKVRDKFHAYLHTLKGE